MEVDITGAQILFKIPIFGGIPITTTITNAWLVMLIIAFVCVFLTRGMKTKAKSKRQKVAELIVSGVTNWVSGNMGSRYASASFPAFIASLFAMSVCCSLLGLFGLYPPTADLSTTMGWAVMIFTMITYTKIRTNKLKGYLKGLAQPVPLLLPLNLVSEISTPLSMAFRHFGNIASGQVVSALIYAALAVLNNVLFGWIPGALGEVLSLIPFVQVGIPAVLSLYFDLFSGFMQAFIFCMLTMSYISAAAEKNNKILEEKL